MRYSLLDLLRALAALTIVIFHIGFRIHNWLGNFLTGSLSIVPGIYAINLGNLAVSAFIILSGLVLALEYRDKKIHFSSFIAKRLLRIYSVYLLIFFFVLILFFISNTGYQIKPGEFVGTLTGFGAFFGLWHATHSFFLFFYLLETSWFIGLIITLYLFFPFTINFLKKYGYYGLFGLFIVGMVSRILTTVTLSPGTSLAGWFPFNRVFEFGLGVYLGLVIKSVVWRAINFKPKWNNFLQFAGQISFPLFLVHWPLLILYFDPLRMIGANILLTALSYLALCLWLSWFFLYLSKIILAKVKYYSRIQ